MALDVYGGDVGPGSSGLEDAGHGLHDHDAEAAGGRVVDQELLKVELLAVDLVVAQLQLVDEALGFAAGVLPAQPEAFEGTSSAGVAVIVRRLAP